VGGKAQVFERALPILQALGSSVTLTGPIGAGNVTKLANQIMVACNIAAIGEALVLATRAGLDPSIVFEAVKGGLAGSNVLNAKAPMVLARNFQPGFRIALAAPETMQVELPFTSLVQQMLLELMNEGKGNLDHSAIVRFLEQMSNVEVSSAVMANA
jgi:2-hydroxy-3-oxopropionate reductase